jgi:heptose-I-phosphate ethanolaminephosphotransferase
MAQTAENVKFVNLSSNSSFESILKSSYDELLLPELSKILEANSSQNLFITIHLMGSHAAYSKRYPPNFEHFKNATDKNQKIINHYDNSIQYTDYVLDSMINILNYFSSKSNAIASFLYCSDHGDNVFDYNNTAGHDYAGYLPDCIVEIPFIIWLSDSYKNKYPNKTNQILNNKDLPFMNDDLFHVILDLQNIETQYFNSSKSVINPNYKVPKKRILEDGREYNKK